MHEKALYHRVIGFVGSLLLTVSAFVLVMYPNFLGQQRAVISLLALAVVQAILQSLFFLNLLNEKRPRWNLWVYLSTTSIILVIVIFSIWIMHHLDYNMMPSC